MAILLDLPDEILCNIFEMLNIKTGFFQHVTSDKPLLSSLMRVNHRLSQLAVRMFMRDVKLDIVTREKKKGDFSRSPPLLHTIEMYSHLYELKECRAALPMRFVASYFALLLLIRRLFKETDSHTTY